MKPRVSSPATTSRAHGFVHVAVDKGINQHPETLSGLAAAGDVPKSAPRRGPIKERCECVRANESWTLEECIGLALGWVRKAQNKRSACGSSRPPPKIAAYD